MNIKRIVFSLALLAMTTAFVAQPAMADTVLYDNTTSQSYSHGGWQINAGYSTTNSFLLASAANMTGFNFVALLTPSSVLNSVNWAITTAPNNGTVLESGTSANPAQNFIEPFTSWSLAQVNVSIPTLALAAGETYWLQLSNAVETSGKMIYWDQSAGQSSAYRNTQAIASETFQVLGSSGAVPNGGGSGLPDSVVPEPSSLFLFGTGMLGLAGLLKRRLTA